MSSKGREGDCTSTISLFECSVPEGTALPSAPPLVGSHPTATHERRDPRVVSTGCAKRWEYAAANFLELRDFFDEDVADVDSWAKHVDEKRLKCPLARIGEVGVRNLKDDVIDAYVIGNLHDRIAPLYALAIVAQDHSEKVSLPIDSLRTHGKEIVDLTNGLVDVNFPRRSPRLVALGKLLPDLAVDLQPQVLAQACVLGLFVQRSLRRHRLRRDFYGLESEIDKILQDLPPLALESRDFENWAANLRLDVVVLVQLHFAANCVLRLVDVPNADLRNIDCISVDLKRAADKFQRPAAITEHGDTLAARFFGSPCQLKKGREPCLPRGGLTSRSGSGIVGGGHFCLLSLRTNSPTCGTSSRLSTCSMTSRVADALRMPDAAARNFSRMSDRVRGADGSPRATDLLSSYRDPSRMTRLTRTVPSGSPGSTRTVMLSRINRPSATSCTRSGVNCSSQHRWSVRTIPVTYATERRARNRSDQSTSPCN